MATTSIANAISAYANTSRSMGIGGDSGASSAASGGVDFASLLQDGAKAAINTGKKSEALSQQAIAGKADIPDVVAAVSNAELTLQTVVAVRDKVVSAYNDILKMTF